MVRVLLKHDLTPLCFLGEHYFIRAAGVHLPYLASRDELAAQLPATTSDDVLDAAFEEMQTERRRRLDAGRDARERKELYASSYTPLRADAYVLAPDQDLAPELLSAVDAVAKARQGSALPGAQRRAAAVHATERPHGVFRLPVLAKEKCAAILEELAHFKQQAESHDWPVGRPNSMNRSGVLLSELGFAPRFLDPLVTDYVSPLVAALFPDHGGGSIDSHRSFTVSYVPKDLDPRADDSLSYHFDDAEATLNVNLGEAGYEGGELLFGGLSDRAHGHDRRVPVPLGVGEGVLHLGCHMHEAAPLLVGRRVNLVVWLRSGAARRQRCPMCGRGGCGFVGGPSHDDDDDAHQG